MNQPACNCSSLASQTKLVCKIILQQEQKFKCSTVNALKCFTDSQLFKLSSVKPQSNHYSSEIQDGPTFSSLTGVLLSSIALSAATDGRELYFCCSIAFDHSWQHRVLEEVLRLEGQPHC